MLTGIAAAPARVADAAALLSVRELSVSLSGEGGPLHIVRGVSFDIRPGEVVGLVGESGCGKSMTALTLMGLHARLPGAEVGGSIVFEGTDLLKLRPGRLRQLAGRRISMIFQEPMSALDPVFTVGEQIAEVVQTHERTGWRAARTRALDALAQVEIPDPARRFHAYPHQLSGGMRQRVMIAMAIVCEPRLLIADEPTTALDVTIQAQIVDLLRGLSGRTGMALLMVSHDLGLVAQTCERVLTMYAGSLVEHGPTMPVLTQPRHPYTSGLLRAMPGTTPPKGELFTIPGRVLPPADDRPGCRFEPRCSHATPACTEPQAMRAAGAERGARCCRWPDLHLPGLWA